MWQAILDGIYVVGQAGSLTFLLYGGWLFVGYFPNDKASRVISRLAMYDQLSARYALQDAKEQAALS